MIKNKKFKKNFLKTLFLFFILAISIFSCSDPDSAPSEETPLIERNIAIVLPLTTEKQKESKDGQQYKKTVEWCLETYRSVRSIVGVNIDFKVSWYDENAYDDKGLRELAKNLSEDKNLAAIIGPIKSSNVPIFADKCRQTEKPLILPGFSSDELLRRYSVSSTGSIKRPFLWTLTETDVSQCEVLMSKLSNMGNYSVSVLSSADPYGDTFYTWASFISSELNLWLLENIRYKPDGYSALNDTIPEAPLSKQEAFERIFDYDPTVVILAMHDENDIKELLQYIKSSGVYHNRLFFTDTAFSADVFSMEDTKEELEGTAPYIDPTNGFIASYREYFGNAPLRCESQLYDSLLFIIYAEIYKSSCQAEFKDFAASITDENRRSNIITNECLKRIGTTSNENRINNSWSKTGVLYMLREIKSGNLPKIEGASGIIQFDSEAFTTILYSTYIHWAIINNKPVIMDYLSASDRRRSTNIRSAWAWTQTINEIEYENSNPPDPKALKDKNAILIAASSGWNNYRHQADVLNMYKFLTSNGFDDKHIIMIMQDDIANNKQNTDKGNIRVSPDGENLYTEKARAGIDAHPSELTPNDISYILLNDKASLKSSLKASIKESLKKENATITESEAETKAEEEAEKKSTRLTFPEGLDDTKNLFLFWSGHGANRNGNGTQGQLHLAHPDKEKWENGIVRDSGFTTELFSETIKKMSSQKLYRKFFIVNESCFGWSVFNAAEGVSGILAITAANGYESSFTDVRNSEMNIWMTNRFTKNFMSYIQSDEKDKGTYTSFYDLYYDLAKKTLGSHVCLINSNFFSNVKTTFDVPAHFIIYKAPL